MSSNIDWDVEKYREEYESDEHWELRKKFMITHKKKFPEDRLVCLAQVFFNVEFLGCRYPEKTMQLVAELSKGVADEHREKQKGKLKRTFVQASDAAGAKVKGLNSPACSTNLTQPSQSDKRFKPDTKNNRAIINFCPAQDNYQSRESLPENFFYIKFTTKEKPEKQSIKKGTGPFADIVIFSSRDQNPLSTIARTCSINKIKYSLQTTNTEDGRFKCEILLDDQVLSTAVGNSTKELTTSAAKRGLEKLAASCYTIEEKCNFVSGGVVLTKDGKPQENNNLDPPADNIGAKIMRLMGWTGNEGLGKNNQGIEKPIEAQHKINRAGLGHSRGNSLRKKFAQIFKEFALGESEHDLVFSPEFTAEERAILHVLARRFKLRTKSFGKGDERHLVVSKAKGDVWKIVEELLATENCETEKYRLIEPSFLNRYSEKTMGIVAELPNGRADERRETENENLTIVKALDAVDAEMKVKTMGIAAELPNGRADEQRETENENLTIVKALDAADAEVKEVESLASTTDLTQPSQANPYTSAANISLCPDQERVSDVDFTKKKSFKRNIEKGTGPFADIVILNIYNNINPQVTITKTCKVNNAKYCMETRKTGGMFKSEIRINGHVLSTAIHSTAKVSKVCALKLGLETLSASCYTVQEKCKIIPQPFVITKDIEPLPNAETIDLPADNIGVKLMKLMGWDGNQGLGKANQGIRTPIEPHLNLVRAGLGNCTTNDLRKKFSSMFNKFASSEGEDDLVFSTEYNEEERIFLHKLAQEFKLRTKYRGKGEKRCLVISKRKKSQQYVNNMWKIVEELLQTENMESEKYRLIEPSFLNRDPEKTEELVVELSNGVADEQEDKETGTHLMFAKPLKAAHAEMKEFIKKKSVKPAKQGTMTFADIILLNKCNELNDQPVNLLRTTCKLNNIKFSIQNKKTRNGKFNCSIYVNGELLSTAVDSTVKTSKLAAIKRGLEILSTSCYTVVEKCRFLSDGTVFTKDSNTPENKTVALPTDNIEMKMTQSVDCSGNQEFFSCIQGTEKQSQGSVLIKDSKTSENTTLDLAADNTGVNMTHLISCSGNKEFVSDNQGNEKQSQGSVLIKGSNTPESTTLDCPADNTGVKMTQLMSCSGNQELVKDNQGTEKYANTHHNVDNTEANLERIPGNDLHKKFAPIFREYAESKSEYDLVFSSEYTDKERKVLHMLATQFKLTSKSYGDGAKRHLVVSKPLGNIWGLFQQLLQSENGETKKYRLVKPLFMNREPEKPMVPAVETSKEVADDYREEEIGNVDTKADIVEISKEVADDHREEGTRNIDTKADIVEISKEVADDHREEETGNNDTKTDVKASHTTDTEMEDNAVGIRIFILAADFPTVLLSTKQLDAVQEEILGKVVKQKDQSLKPKFFGITYKPGYMVLTCANQETASWIMGLGGELEPWKRARLRIVDEQNLPRNVGYFPKSTKDSSEKMMIQEPWEKGKEKRFLWGKGERVCELSTQAELRSPVCPSDLMQPSHSNKCFISNTFFTRADSRLCPNQGNVSDTDSIKENSVKPDIKQEAVPFTNIVIFKPKKENESPMFILNRTCEINKLKLSKEQTRTVDGNFKCRIFINGQELSAVVERTKRVSRKCAAKLGLENLRALCYTHKEKSSCLLKRINLTTSTEPTENTSVGHHLADNIGAKIPQLTSCIGNQKLVECNHGIGRPIKDHEKTVEFAADLSKGVSVDYKEKETGKTIMLLKALDAADTEVEEVRSPVCPNDLMQPSNKCCMSDAFCTRDDSSLCPDQGIVSDKDSIEANSVKPDVKQRAVPFADIVTFTPNGINEDPLSVLCKICKNNNLNLSYETRKSSRRSFKTIISINGQQLSAAVEKNKKVSRKCAARLGIEILRASYCNHNDKTSFLLEGTNLITATELTENTTVDHHLSENIGVQIPQLMVYTGNQELVECTQGIGRPVENFEKTVELATVTSKGVTADYKEKETGKTIMLLKALDAADTEVEAVKSPSYPTDLSQSLHINECYNLDTCSRRVDDSIYSDQGSVSDMNFIKENSLKPDIKQRTGPFADIVIFKPSEINICPRTILFKTCQLNKVWFSHRGSRTEDGKFISEMLINGNLLSTAVSNNKKETRTIAAHLGLKKLSASCYTIVQKCQVLSGGTILTRNTKPPENTAVNLPTDNSGVKTSELMDYNDNQKLVKDNQGIDRPIKTHSGENYLRKTFAPIFREYVKSKSEYDLCFSTEFTGEERNKLSMLAGEFKLQSNSYNKKGMRYLVVSKPLNDIRGLFQQLLGSENYETEKYRLIQPSF